MRLRNTLTAGLVEHLNPIKDKLLPYAARGIAFADLFVVWFCCLGLFWRGALSWARKLDR